MRKTGEFRLLTLLAQLKFKTKSEYIFDSCDPCY